MVSLSHAMTKVGGRKVKSVTGTNISRVSITKLPRRKFRVKVLTLTTKNLLITSQPTYRACLKGARVGHQAPQALTGRKASG